jgi:hypothetical protein
MRFLPEDEDLYSWNYTWTQRGRSITFIAGRVAWENDNGKFAVYEAAIDDATLVEIAKTSTPIVDWWKGTTFVRGFTGETLTWLRADGTYTEFKPYENCQMGSDFQGGSFSRRSPSGYLLYAAECPNGDQWLYWANPDGTEIGQVLDAPLTAANGGLTGIFWSPADKYTALNLSTSGITYLHVLDVENGSLLAQVPIGGGDLFYNISWQPPQGPRLHTP